MTGGSKADVSKGLSHVQVSAKGTVPSPASAGIAEGMGTGEGCLLLPQTLISATREIDGCL